MLSVSGYRGIELKHYEHEEQKRASEDLKDYRVVRKGQLVVNTMWLNYAGLGVSDLEGHVSPAYRSYWISERLDKKYIHYLMRSHVYVQGYTGQMQGIRPNSLQIKNVDFFKFPIVIPSIAEQKRIAEFLDRKCGEIDEAISKKQRLIELLEEQKTILINQAVTKGLDPNVPMKDSGIDWLGEIPEHWKVCSLSYLANLTAGGTPDRSKSEYWNGDIPWLKTGEINYNFIEISEEYITEKGLKNSSAKIAPIGTILMAMYGQGITRGRVAILGIKATFNQATLAICVKEKIYNEFLYYYLIGAYQFIRDTGNETSQMNLSSGVIGKIKISFPEKKEQEEISNFLDVKLVEFEDIKKEYQIKYRN
ncbi:MAG: restriction endonuclease subunit S [Limnothrix sp. RL_2_0]|nr:restriction endonuclease subunit S [Limnothrix sp. RL_2_0]